VSNEIKQFEINEHSVVVNPNLHVIALPKKHYLEIYTGSKDGVWVSGYSYQQKYGDWYGSSVGASFDKNGRTFKNEDEAIEGAKERLSINNRLIENGMAKLLQYKEPETLF